MKSGLQVLVPLVLALAVADAAVGHGAPEVSVRQSAVAPGQRITVSGDGMGGAGDTVTLILQGVMYQATLGTIKLKSDGFDATTFTVPAAAPPGTYVIAAKNGDISATTQIEVTPPPASRPGTPGPPAGTSAPESAAPSSGGETGMSPAGASQGAETVITRARTPLEWGISIGLVVVTGALAVVLLWRSRSDLVRLDR